MSDGNYENDGQCQNGDECQRCRQVNPSIAVWLTKILNCPLRAEKTLAPWQSLNNLNSFFFLLCLIGPFFLSSLSSAPKPKENMSSMKYSFRRFDWSVRINAGRKCKPDTTLISYRTLQIEARVKNICALAHSTGKQNVLYESFLTWNYREFKLMSNCHDGKLSTS